MSIPPPVLPILVHLKDIACSWLLATRGGPNLIIFQFLSFADDIDQINPLRLRQMYTNIEEIPSHQLEALWHAQGRVMLLSRNRPPA